MKLKYYLRGFGLGIILTAVIMIIVTHSNRNNLSNAEIINKAESLGMVMSDQSSKTKDTNKGSTIKQQIKDEETNQTTTPEQAEQPVQEFVSVVIQRGEVSIRLRRNCNKQDLFRMQRFLTNI